MPYVSVIIPAYNAADFIADAYRSIVAQTIDDWEIIFVNDGSDDDTFSVVQSFAVADPRVKVINLQSNAGPAHARNAGILIAAGDWIAVLDADDRYSSDRLEVMIGAAERTGADIVLDNQFIVDPISKRVVFLAFEPPQEDFALLTFTDFLHNTQSDTFFDFGYLKPVIRRGWLIANEIKYQEQLRLGEDLMLLFECYARDAKVTLVSTPHYYYNFQYSHASQTESPTTRTESTCEPLLAAAQEFLESQRFRQSLPERRLVASACESLREIVIAAAFKDYFRSLNVISLISCLRHPLRLFRGLYFEKRRAFLFRRRAMESLKACES
jgi:succinoglycan biosynthesis protein ExoO